MGGEKFPAVTVFKDDELLASHDWQN